MVGVIAVAAVVLVASGPASARRPATSSERSRIVAAVKQKDMHDQLSGLAGHWTHQLRCNKLLVYVSTVDARWAALWFESKYLRSKPPQDPRYIECERTGPSIDGVWVARRTASGRWAGAGWIWGDHEGFCDELAVTGVTGAAFKDLDQFKRTCAK